MRSQYNCSRISITRKSPYLEQIFVHRQKSLRNSYKELSIARISITRKSPYLEQVFVPLGAFSLHNSNKNSKPVFEINFCRK